jgi:PAT family beta-lactamase induction signal transducer AmpG
MLSLGFSAGLPLLLILGTLSFWLREAGIDRSTIGYFSWIGLAYGFKWMWSPLVDRLRLPLLTQLLGRRRAWILLSQVLITIALVGMANTDPLENLTHMVFFALAVAFASATQDIALDAYRIEAVALRLQGAMAATYQAGYRLAMILASAGVLWIAAAVDPSETTYDYSPWRTAYLVMAASMAVGIITTLIIREPEVPVTRLISENEDHAKRAIAHWNLNEQLTQILAWLYGAIVAPFRDFIVRHHQRALLILALIAVYRISDVVMGVMSNPFYVDMGYTKDEVATVSKVYGVIMTIVGAAIGGVLIAKIGIMRTLFLGAVLSAATNLLFVWLAGRGHDVAGLVFTISADNLSAGIATSAFIAYLSGLTNSAYSATQYALFSSVMLLLPKFIAGFSGNFVDTYGYASFFTATALLGLPVLVLVWLAGQEKFKAPDIPSNSK